MRTRLAAVAAALLLSAGCAEGGTSTDEASPTTTGTGSATATTSPRPTPGQTRTTARRSPPSATPKPGTVPPRWLFRRPLPLTAEGFGEIRPTPPELRNRRFTLPDNVAMLPGDGYASRVVSPPPARVLARSTWKPGCPVRAGDLAWVRVAFRGFDGERHTGELLVNTSVTEDVVRVFRRLWRAEFPLEQMRITTLEELDAHPTGDGNNTSAFVCRVVRGGSSFSQHAHGLAIDVNPFHNPYVKGDLVLPELASAYRDRSRDVPGIITADGPVVAAFRAVGWEWGGAWRTLKDYQHFSAEGG
jgi:hypothetical protein